MTIAAQQRSDLVRRAIEVRARAYAPYSHYAVGAALLTESGRIFTGVNVENAAYPSSVCAERSALFAAISEGERVFQAIAVVTDNAGSPCGTCRQVLAEFGTDILVIQASADGEIKRESTVAELLPFSFGPDNLDEPRSV